LKRAPIAHGIVIIRFVPEVAVLAFVWTAQTQMEDARDWNVLFSMRL
jgi:hypothetical protein